MAAPRLELQRALPFEPRAIGDPGNCVKREDGFDIERKHAGVLERERPVAVPVCGGPRCDLFRAVVGHPNEREARDLFGQHGLDIKAPDDGEVEISVEIEGIGGFDRGQGTGLLLPAVEVQISDIGVGVHGMLQNCGGPDAPVEMATGPAGGLIRGLGCSSNGRLRLGESARGFCDPVATRCSQLVCGGFEGDGGGSDLRKLGRVIPNDNTDCLGNSQARHL